jgi:DNA polymerase III alpha subunit (gram-positive type)
MAARQLVCPYCGSGEVLAVTMALDGSQLSVRACSECGERDWDRNGHRISVEEALGRPIRRRTGRR